MRLIGYYFVSASLLAVGATFHGPAAAASNPLTTVLGNTAEGQLDWAWSGSRENYLRGKVSDKPRAILKCGTPLIGHLVLSPDRKSIASTHKSNSRLRQRGGILLWDLSTKKPTRILEGDTVSLDGLAFGKDSKILAPIVWKNMHFWSLRSGKLKTVLETDDWNDVAKNASLFDLAFHLDGKIIAAAGRIGTRVQIYLLDMNTGKTARTLKGHTDSVVRLAFSPSGKSLVSAGADRTVRRWSTTTGKLSRVIGRHVGVVRALAFRPSGKLIASGDGHNHRVAIWDSATGKLKRKLIGHTGNVCGLLFSADGNYLASSAYGHDANWEITTWSMKTGKATNWPNP